MKYICGTILLLLFFAACRKEAKNNQTLTGTWVEKIKRLDTLEVYKSNGKYFMFDNSKAYRDFRGQWMTDNAFRVEFNFRNHQIGFRYDGGTEFFYQSFTWNRLNQEFTMPYNGFRPYLSSIGNITYERVK